MAKLSDLGRIAELHRQLETIDAILSGGIDDDASVVWLGDGRRSFDLRGIVGTALMCGLQDLRDQVLLSLRELGIDTSGSGETPA